jgi:hypothetical protein
MKKYIISILILVFLITINVPAFFMGFNDPCVYRTCPDAGYGGDGLIKYIVDTTPPNFYVPAGIVCGAVCFDYPAHINWGLFGFDMIIWGLATFFIFWGSRNKYQSEHIVK